MERYLLTKISKNLEVLINKSVAGLTVTGVRCGGPNGEVNWIEMKIADFFILCIRDESLNWVDSGYLPNLLTISVEHIENKQCTEEFAYEQAKVVYNKLRSEVLPNEFGGLEISHFYKEGANDIFV